MVPPQPNGWSSSSYKIDYFIVIKNPLNPKGQQNPINGSKVTVILMKGWILHIGGPSAVEGLQSTGLSRLVFFLQSGEASRWRVWYQRGLPRLVL